MRDLLVKLLGVPVLLREYRSGQHWQSQWHPSSGTRALAFRSTASDSRRRYRRGRRVKSVDALPDGRCGA